MDSDDSGLLWDMHTKGNTTSKPFCREKKALSQMPNHGSTFFLA